MARAIADVAAEQILADVRWAHLADRALKRLREFIKPQPQVALVNRAHFAFLFLECKQLVNDFANRDVRRTLRPVLQKILDGLEQGSLAA